MVSILLRTESASSSRIENLTVGARQLALATVPVSAGLLASTDGYFAALDRYRDGDFGPFVEEFSQASLTSISHGHRLLDDVQAAQRRWTDTVRARRDAAPGRPAGRAPRCFRSEFVELLQVAQPAADRAISQLVEAAVLTR